jgi:hypothetical protein
MTAHRAMYFMERFKREEKLLGPNEQAAVDFVIAMLNTTPQQCKPLTEERVDYIYAQLVAGQLESIEEQEEDPIRIFARAIEAAHGIKE